MKRYAGLQTVIKTGIYHQCAIREVRALRSFGPENILTCVGFHSVCLKLACCRWCESERWRERGGGGSNDREEKDRGKRVLRMVGTAFTGLYLVHKFLFDPAGDGFPSVGLWMSRDQG